MLPVPVRNLAVPAWLTVYANKHVPAHCGTKENEFEEISRELFVIRALKVFQFMYVGHFSEETIETIFTLHERQRIAKQMHSTLNVESLLTFDELQRTCLILDEEIHIQTLLHEAVSSSANRTLVSLCMDRSPGILGGLTWHFEVQFV